MLADRKRIKILWALLHGESSVNELAERVGASSSVVSQHLAKLRLAGLVSARREGRRQFYTVDDPHVVALVEQIFEHVAPDGTLAPDPPRRALSGWIGRLGRHG
jgi:DNA-binding transcriptional ArsR family regulator